jgi:hypothetical protein
MIDRTYRSPDASPEGSRIASPTMGEMTDTVSNIKGLLDRLVTLTRQTARPVPERTDPVTPITNDLIKRSTRIVRDGNVTFIVAGMSFYRFAGRWYFSDGGTTVLITVPSTLEALELRDLRQS